MTREEIIARNKLIAEFMGVKPKSVIPNIYYWNDAPFYFVSEDTEEKVMTAIIGYVKYHSSWDWLMPVVRKIVTLCCDRDDNEYTESDEFQAIEDTIPSAEFESAFRVVVEFIEWYNEQPK